MPLLLVAVIDDPAKVWDVLDEWDRLGVSGGTVFDSTGLHRVQHRRDDLPLFPSVHDLLAQTEAHHRTIWSVLEDDVNVKAIVDATEAILGPLHEPRTGILFTIPVIQVWGLRRPRRNE